MCGSWVAALPELIADTAGESVECLQSAVKALALSITAHRTGKNMLQIISTRYEHSLQLLAQDLVAAGHMYRNRLVAAVMCLALTEVKMRNLARISLDLFASWCKSRLV